MLAGLQYEQEGAPVAKAHTRYTECAAFWKRPAAKTFEECEEYPLAALCYKSASACSMRAFRLRQKHDATGGDALRSLKKEVQQIAGKIAATPSDAGLVSDESIST